MSNKHDKSIILQNNEVESLGGFVTPCNHAEFKQ